MSVFTFKRALRVEDSSVPQRSTEVTVTIMRSSLNGEVGGWGGGGVEASFNRFKRKTRSYLQCLNWEELV